jgi:hypothetical protein
MMKLKFLACLISFACCSQVNAQLRSLEKGMPKELAKELELEEIPATGSFWSVQVASITLDYLKHDYKMCTGLMLFRPVYVDFDHGVLAIGCFAGLADATAFCKRLKCVFRDCFVVAGPDGEKTYPGQNNSGNLPERKPNIDAAVQKLEKIINTGYYRLQVGYYEQPGFTTNEQQLFDQLNDAGITLIAQNYKKGRLMVTTQTYVTLREAASARDKMQDLIGREVLFKAYGKPEFIDIQFAEEIYECLK